MREGLGKDRHRRVRGKNAVAVARKGVRNTCPICQLGTMVLSDAEQSQANMLFDGV
jgi:hypothetical protein